MGGGRLNVPASVGRARKRERKRGDNDKKD